MFRFNVTVSLSFVRNLNTIFFLLFVSVELLFIVFLIYVVNEGRISISKVLFVRVAAVL